MKGNVIFPRFNVFPCFQCFQQLVGLLSQIEKAIVDTAGAGWGHCAPSACTKTDFYNNYKVKVNLFQKLYFILYIDVSAENIFCFEKLFCS